MQYVDKPLYNSTLVYNNNLNDNVYIKHLNTTSVMYFGIYLSGRHCFCKQFDCGIFIILNFLDMLLVS